MLKSIKLRMQELYDEMEDTDTTILSLSLGSNQLGETSRSNNKSDLSDLLIRQEHLIRERATNVRAELWRLLEWQESIERIWLCYRSLDSKAFWIITELYVYKKLYSTVENESNMSHGSFEKMRSIAIKEICKLYKSDFSNFSIITHGKGEEIKKKNRKKNETYEQLKFNL